MKYVGERIKPNANFPWKEGEATTKHVIEIIATKFARWAYEEEHRLFVKLDEKDDNGLYFYDFGEQLVLREIIVGVCSAVTRPELEGALGTLEPSVSIFKGRLAFQAFSVDRGNF